MPRSIINRAIDHGLGLIEAVIERVSDTDRQDRDREALIRAHTRISELAIEVQRLEDENAVLREERSARPAVCTARLAAGPCQCLECQHISRGL